MVEQEIRTQISFVERLQRTAGVYFLNTGGFTEGSPRGRR